MSDQLVLLSVHCKSGRVIKIGLEKTETFNFLYQCICGSLGKKEKEFSAIVYYKENDSEQAFPYRLTDELVDDFPEGRRPLHFLTNVAWGLPTRAKEPTFLIGQGRALLYPSEEKLNFNVLYIRDLLTTSESLDSIKGELQSYTDRGVTLWTGSEEDCCRFHHLSELADKWNCPIIFIKGEYDEKDKRSFLTDGVGSTSTGGYFVRGIDFGCGNRGPDPDGPDDQYKEPPTVEIYHTPMLVMPVSQLPVGRYILFKQGPPLNIIPL
jgi:hypothetical protein